MFRKKWILIATALTALAACGDTLGEQLAGGALAGGGVAAVTGGNVAGGAAVGAVGNAAYCQSNPGRC